MEKWKRKERARLTWEGRQKELSIQVQSRRVKALWGKKRGQ